MHKDDIVVLCNAMEDLTGGPGGPGGPSGPGGPIPGRVVGVGVTVGVVTSVFYYIHTSELL